MPSAIPFLFLLLMAAAIFPPFIPLAGPLSLDDLLPVFAGLLGLAVIPFSRRRPQFDATVIGFTLLALTALVSNAVNSDTLSDFLRLTGRSTGRIIFYQAVLLGARAVLDRGPWPRRAVIFLIAAATLESLFCIWAFIVEYHGPYGLGIVGFAEWSVLVGKVRVQGTFSGSSQRYETASVSANFLAAYLVMSIPVTVAMLLVVKHRVWRLVLIASALLQLATLYVTYTRAALIALGSVILAMGFLAGRRKLAIAVLVTAIVATLSIPTVRAKFLGEGHDRWSLYWASSQLTFDHALFGVGDGKYEYVLHENQRYHETPFGLATTTSHNSILLSAANYGLLGGLAFALLYLLMLAVSIREVARARDPRARTLLAGIVAGLMGYLMQDQFNNLSYVPKVSTQMWFLFALVPLISRSFRAEAEPEGAEDQRVVRLYPGLAAVTSKGVDRPYP